MPLSPSLDLDNEYFRVEHISDARDGRNAIEEFSAGDEAKGLERYLKETALRDYETLGFRRLDADTTKFVNSRVKPKYDRGCVFMFRDMESTVK